MKNRNAYYFLAFILISGVAACGPRKEQTPPGRQETAKQETAQPESLRTDPISMGESRGRLIGRDEREKLVRCLEERKALLETAQSGDDENMTYVRLTRENEYTDPLSGDLSFARDSTSGPGTGKFTGEGFEFAEGACADIAAQSEDEKPVRWGKRIFKCRSRILESDWCARRKDEPSETYTISFLSWTVSNEECIGYCREHDDSTAYIRVKNRDE